MSGIPFASPAGAEIVVFGSRAKAQNLVAASSESPAVLLVYRRLDTGNLICRATFFSEAFRGFKGDHAAEVFRTSSGLRREMS